MISFDEFYTEIAGYQPSGRPCWSRSGNAVVWHVARRKLWDDDAGLELLVISVSTGQAERIGMHFKGIVSIQEIDWR